MAFTVRSRWSRFLQWGTTGVLAASVAKEFYYHAGDDGSFQWPGSTHAAVIHIGGDGSESFQPVQPPQPAGETTGGTGGIAGKLRSLVGAMPEDSDGCCSMVAHRTLDKLKDFLNADDSTGKENRPPRSVLVNLYGQAGVTPLMLASYRGDEEAIEVLLAAHADLDMCSCTNPKEENTKIIELQTRKTTEGRRGAQWAQFIADKATGALSRQSIAGDVWRAYFSGLNPTAGEGWTAVDFALIAGRLEIAVLLMEKGARKPSDATINYLAKKNANGFFGTGNSSSQDAVEKAKLDIRIKLDQAKERSTELQRQKRSQFPLESRLHENIVGQEHAVGIVSSAIRRKENGWVDTDSPLVLLFMGSSGIGKTETAKLVAKYLFAGDDRGASTTSSALNTMRRRKKEADDEEELTNGHPVLKQLSNLTKKPSPPKGEKDQPEWQRCFVRMDMTEFQSKHEVSKFIGAPPGYVGYDEGGQLVKKLQECPNAVVLLDEVEKAHPDVLTVMLQAFDEGRLTDGQGETVDCKDAIFIMTSNLGQRQIADEAVRLREAVVTSGGHSISTVDGLTKKFKRHVVQPILRHHFGRDEFLGRINEIVFFLPFTLQEQKALARKELKKWSHRALERHRIDLTWDPAVETQVAQGYDLRYGARSIKYEIDRTVIATVARAQEEGEVTRGCRVQLGVDENALKAQAAQQKSRKVETDVDADESDDPRLDDWRDMGEEGDVVVPIMLKVTPNAVSLDDGTAKKGGVFGGLFS